MLWPHCLQAYGCLPVFQLGNESPALVLHVERLALCLEVCVELGQFLPEVVDLALEVGVGHKEVFLHVFLLHAVA